MFYSETANFLETIFQIQVIDSHDKRISNIHFTLLQMLVMLMSLIFTKIITPISLQSSEESFLKIYVQFTSLYSP